ncbi:MAG: NAD(P)/FAD-dependent oxidoreductase [Chloroflexota bacterium]
MGTSGGAVITADYLVKGAGAVGMAFADQLFTDTDATIAIVDRHDRPGGHWNEAYPFVRLHQPAGYYGVSSTPLGTGAIDQVGLNAGFFELASGQEVLAHFDTVLRHRLLPSGRVTFLSSSEVDDDGVVTSLLSGVRTRVEHRRFVDATHSGMQVPATTPPAYAIADGVTCVPVGRLPAVAAGFAHFTVVGAGKTGMDACVWLLEQGAAPEQIRWIMPRDSWLLRRANFQPGAEHFAAFAKSIADQVTCVVEAEGVDDLFLRLEAAGELSRIDPTVTPGAYHCAVLSDPEIELLRRIGDVVRLGRVRAIHADRLELERGTIDARADSCYIDCSAAGIPTLPSTPIFAGRRITPQWMRTCQPTFSAAFIAHVEATFPDDDDRKNGVCRPIVPPTVPVDWLRMLRVQLDNRAAINATPELHAWQAETRLDAFWSTARVRLGVDQAATAHLQRYAAHVGPARARLEELLAGLGA